MIEYVILSLVKVLDNIIGTAKSIAVYNERKILSSILVVISQLIFYMVVSQVISDNSLTVIILVSIASGLGNFIAMAINDKVKKDLKYTMIITSSYSEGLRLFCEHLKEHNIKYIVSDGYDRQWNDTMNIIAFSKTKDESRLIKKYLESSNFKYLLEVI
jgi:hypothetical protein